MPKPKKAGLATGAGLPVTEGGFLPAKKYDHSPSGMQELRDFFRSEMWAHVLSNVRAQKPPEFPVIPLGADTDMRVQLMAEQLVRIQGWRLFEVALAKESMPPPQRAPVAQDTYPDSGRIDNDKAFKK